MLDPKTLKNNIIADMRVELAEEFDKNFTRKAFFTDKWKKRRNPNALGSLLVFTGSLRRSIQAKETPDGVRFTSNQPYATLHNEGGKGSVTVRQHTRKSIIHDKPSTCRSSEMPTQGDSANGHAAG